MKKIFYIFTIFSLTLLMTGMAQAATTIGTNINTGGTVTAGGNIILQNAETISNSTDGLITITSATTTTSGDIYITKNLKVGNGTPTVTLNNEDAYIEGTFEVDGLAYFDNTATTTFAGDTYITKNLKVGNGTPSVALNNEDAYIEGTFEVDGTSNLAGAVTFGGNLVLQNAETIANSSDGTISLGGNYAGGGTLLSSSITENTAAADSTRYNSFVVAASADPAASAEVTNIYGAYNWSAGTNGTFIANGVEGVARSTAADEAGTFRGGYFRTYTNGGTMRTAVGLEASARTAADTVAEAGTAFVGTRIWMAPNFTGGTVANVNNFHGLWIYNETTNQKVTNAIKINDGGGTGGWTNGISMSGATIGTADIVLSSSDTIKNSSASTTIVSGNLTATGDLTVSGNDITFGNAETISNATDNTILITSALTKTSGNLDVGGNATTTAASGNFVTNGTITSANTGALGWAIVAGTNTACNTTCTKACVFGIDSEATATSSIIVACTSAAADNCLCAGAN